jgi:hypothetical protein
MNNWIQAHKKTLQEFRKVDGYWGYKYYEVEAIPVSSLEELFSKDGEQLAREMYPVVSLTDAFNLARREGFIEAYNLQEVKIASSMLNIDSLLSEFERQGISTENWDGEDGAERAIVDGVQNLLIEKEDQIEALNKEVEELRDAVVKFQAELFEAVNNPNYKYETPQP